MEIVALPKSPRLLKDFQNNDNLDMFTLLT